MRGLSAIGEVRRRELGYSAPLANRERKAARRGAMDGTGGQA